ncbi:uncharacterized protein LOC113338027 [Papaver somniferum]|uniref:uncharacterized protein LOC113338027 n=1 Tax=Papaver somniferum TaxID=3469 RepID=UPI000E6FD489|nr:uncharacterized protein LOC113338027 [Papaver somniferum]
MNLALVFVTFKSVRPVIWTCSTSVTLVAALAIAYDRRDPTGFSEGITTGFFISFLTQLVEDDSNKHKLAVHWGVATFLCWLCSVARPPPQQGPQIQQGPGGQPPPVLQLGPQIPQAPGGQQPGVQQLGPQIHQAPGGQPPAVQQLGPLLQAAPGQPQQLDQEFFSVFRHQVSTFRNNVLTSRSHSTSSSDIRRNNLGIVIQ